MIRVLQPFGRIKPDHGSEIFFRYSQIKSNAAQSRTETRTPVSIGDALDFYVDRDEIGPFAVDIEIVEKMAGQQRSPFGRFRLREPHITNITTIDDVV